MKELFYAFLAVFGIMSVVGFLIMLIDKKKAEKGQWRIKEATLFLVAFLFGGVGTTLGMFVFRHKTKHWYFRVGMPFLALLNVAVLVLLYVL